MRTVFFVAAVGLVASLFGMPAASQEPATTDLFGRNMKDWSRTGTGTNPWRLTTGDTLICDRGASELYIPERLFADGTLTFEYRFIPAAPKAGYRAAVYVRRPQESGIGVRIDLGDECGKLTATTFSGSSDREKKIEERPSVRLARPTGDWNTLEVVCEGRSVTVKVNGKAASAMSQCDLETGLIALAAEGSEMEFRRMTWKEGK